MHSRGVLHRDIQLGNCVIGLESRHETIYMIDFGFAKQYVDSKQRHIANRTERSFIGNYWFSSVNVHCRGKSARASLSIPLRCPPRSTGYDGGLFGVHTY